MASTTIATVNSMKVMGVRTAVASQETVLRFATRESVQTDSNVMGAIVFPERARTCNAMKVHIVVKARASEAVTACSARADKAASLGRVATYAN